jgi:hypothetical protein
VGKVPIWKQWLIVVAGLALSPVFAGLAACFIGCLFFRRFWSGDPRFARNQSLGNHSIRK